ncbi:hypothetical protein [Bradyrhizobium guangzhouense]|uniref:hypothetical protein n=1 Tax=Bradyrhizobium guangzhouense TaxID=1325095 RepID=UPI0019D70CFD|nr:hypothetical protein [Bradyrhizobium guangzhouense]
MPDIKERQQRAINMICSGEDLDRINAFARTRPSGDLPVVFFRGQLLELMRWAVRCCDAAVGAESLEDPAGRSRLLQAALIASKLWGERVFAGRLSGVLPVDDARKLALGAFRRGLEESAIAPHIGATLGRGWALFSEHFPRHYPDFAAEFLDATGLTVEQYFTCVTGLALYLPFDSEGGALFNAQTVADATAYREKFAKYMDSESQTPEELAVTLWDGFTERGYRDLRERPILRLANGRAIIIDPVFFSEKISVGPLFHLLPKARSANEVFGAFGNAFEDYANGILRRMYPDRPGLASRLQCGVEACDRENRDFEIDALLDYIPQTVIFEQKAAWLKDEIVLGDIDDWIEQIRSRYGIATASAGGKKERPKGVAQLAQIVRRILDGNCGEAQRAFDGVAVIHPVLLVHDTRLNAPAYGTFLDSEFRRLLGEVPGGRRVMTLAIMTISDLENLESSVSEFAMQQLLADYACAHPEGLVSLHNFMVHDERYADRIKPSPQLMADSQRLIELAQRELFPKSAAIVGP